MYMHSLSLVCFNETLDFPSLRKTFVLQTQLKIPKLSQIMHNVVLSHIHVFVRWKISPTFFHDRMQLSKKSDLPINSQKFRFSRRVKRDRSEYTTVISPTTILVFVN